MSLPVVMLFDGFLTGHRTTGEKRMFTEVQNLVARFQARLGLAIAVIAIIVVKVTQKANGINV